MSYLLSLPLNRGSDPISSTTSLTPPLCPLHWTSLVKASAHSGFESGLPSDLTAALPSPLGPRPLTASLCLCSVIPMASAFPSYQGFLGLSPLCRCHQSHASTPHPRAFPRRRIFCQPSVSTPRIASLLGATSPSQHPSFCGSSFFSLLFGTPGLAEAWPASPRGWDHARQRWQCMRPQPHYSRSARKPHSHGLHCSLQLAGQPGSPTGGSLGRQRAPESPLTLTLTWRPKLGPG